MTELATLDTSGALIEPTTVKIQRLLPGPSNASGRISPRANYAARLAAGQIQMEMKVGAPVEFVWRNKELTNPPGQRPPGSSDEHRMQSRITELDPPRKLSIAWTGSGDVSLAQGQ